MNIKEQFRLSIGSNINGSPLSVTGYRFSRGNGPAVYIQGGTHGGEITFPIFRLLNDFLLKNENWKGTVTLIPITNPISWNQRSQFYTVGKFNYYDGKDWNRSFPGNEEGSTAERCAHMIFTEASKHDIVIDLHTSRLSKPFFIVSRKDLIEYGICSGILPTYLSPAMKTSLPLPDAIDVIGKKGITIECGSHDSIDKENIRQCFDAVLNLMRLEGLLNDSQKPKIVNNSFVFIGYDTYFAPASGFVEYIHPLEKSLKKGDILYRLNVSDALDKTLDILAREDCIIMKYQPTHIATIGDQVVMVVPKKKYNKKVE